MLSPVVLADFSEDDLKMGQISGFPFEKQDVLTQPSDVFGELGNARNDTIHCLASKFNVGEAST